MLRDIGILFSKIKTTNPMLWALSKKLRKSWIRSSLIPISSGWENLTEVKRSPFDNFSIYDIEYNKVHMQLSYDDYNKYLTYLKQVDKFTTEGLKVATPPWKE